MCLGNRAESSAHYINSQLVSLYENATQCTRKHGTGLKPTSSVVEYSTCLYEWYGPGKHTRHQPSKADLAFYVKFGAPRIEFVCNHEVILFLTLKEGHYALDLKGASKQSVERIKDFTVAFRVEFTTHSVEKFKCSAIGNSADYIMNMHILNMESATLVSEHSSIPGITTAVDGNVLNKSNALQHYLKHYLHIFKCGGFHVLYSLPDFDNLSITTAHIDYSVISKHTLAVDNLYACGFKLMPTTVNTLASDKDVTKTFLAEHRTNWKDSTEDIQIHITSGPLQIQALCKREVIMYIDLQDIRFHTNGYFTSQAQHEFSDWKIAFIVDIIYEEADQGCVKRVKLNLGTARFCEHLSFFGAQTIEVDLFTRLRTTLVRYLTHHYLHILETSEYHCVYHHDTRVHVDIGEDEPYGPGEPGEFPDDDHPEGGYHGGTGLGDHDCECESESECGHKGGIQWGILTRGLVEYTHCSDFDIVTSVTQGSVNSTFYTWWEAAHNRFIKLGKRHTWESVEIERDTCLADYSFVHEQHADEVFFSASFLAPRIQLICKEGSQSVLLYFNIQSGFLRTLGQGKTLQPGSEIYNFSNWRIAFEVQLKLVDASESSISNVILKRYGRTGHSSFKHLILDLSTAKFSLTSSHCPGLLDGQDYRLIRVRREALVHYFTHHYFAAFKRARHHILYTIPLFDKNGVGNHRHTVTSLKFQILPFTAGTSQIFEGLFGKYRALFDRNVVVFLGMVDNHQMPTGWLPGGMNWVGGAGTKIPHGTVSLSRKSFLEARILQKLEAINRDTTIFATLGAVEGGKWKPELMTWNNHQTKKNLSCHFHQTKSTSESLEFCWYNKDQWTYTHEGEFDGNGLYKVNCTTKNTVSVPTTKRANYAISVKGRVDLNLAYQGNGRDWSAEMYVTWSAIIKLTSEGHGLTLHVLPAKIVPEFHNSRVEGNVGHNAQEIAFEQLRKQFPGAIEFSTVTNELRDSFEGSWTGLHVESREMVLQQPIFNKRGDLMCELAPMRRYTTGTLNGGANGVNGHANESWFRHAVHRVDSFINGNKELSAPPTPISPSPQSPAGALLSRTSSKASVSSTKSTSSTKTVTKQTSSSSNSFSSSPISLAEGQASLAEAAKV
ncbi:hypothetical protein K435DRAFT_839574 [Dendrothele bispora CBS 962.96]|uniref:Uncharacterized protein n=1 Tax=Dendrothele bispora (strain CBS 962.96) TaxID=1314807 RepID=A0A4S8LZW3_DENBC|nr:hypothetical protein K435DRAFT_839574 [Dendrothele bispora CBS 962.96]